MSEKTTNKIDKKILENPFVGSLVVPVAIVLVGALIIFGVTKMISSEHNYKNLVQEMKSKTFGNKWVAALELSKVIASDSIPKEDIPWLIESLDEIYSSSIDSRTRDFTIVAIGSLRDKRGLKTLDKALSDPDENVKFHAIVSLGNMPKDIVYDWSTVTSFLDSKDYALVQAAVLSLATHQVVDAQGKAKELLRSQLGYGVRYAAATALIRFKDESALPTVKEVMSLNEKSLDGKMTVEDIRGLKYNILKAVQQVEWQVAAPILKDALLTEKDIKIVARGKEVLNLLKK